MRYIFFFIVSSLLPLLCAAQESPRCGLDHLIDQELQKNPSYQEELDDYSARLQRLGPTARPRMGDSFVIPVVVHVIHSGSAEGSGANLSEDQILTQIDLLNEDYGRRNPDADNTPATFRSLGADTEIQFCLARTDPEGNLTDGITRHRYNNVSSTSFIEDVVKPATSWNPRRYLNIWTVDIPNSTILGYSFLPTASKLYTPQDGVVISYDYFGYNSPTNRGRTTTHEVGHYLGLKHPWGDSDSEGEPVGCSSDDGVSDTPEQSVAYYNCPSFPQSSCGSTDMFMNYMDYTNDDCMNLFTAGQTSLMHSILENQRSGLITNAQATCQLIDCVDTYDLRNGALLMGFEAGEPYDCWIIENKNDDEESWNIYEDPNNGETGAKTGISFLGYFWNEDQVTPADDYIFTPFFTIEANRVYELRFDMAAGQNGGTTFPERLEVGYSFTRSSSDFGLISDEWKFDPVNNAFPNFKTGELYFQSDGAGRISLGFHVFSDADQYALQIDDISIKDVGSTVGVEDKILARSFQLSPNPAQNLINVGISLESELAEVRVVVTDVLGRVVQTRTLDGVREQQLQFDLSEEAPGLYFVTIRSGHRRATKKLVKL